jgi:hypothetical protein
VRSKFIADHARTRTNPDLRRSEFKRRIFRRDLREISLALLGGIGFFVFGGLLLRSEPERLAAWLNVKTLPATGDLVALLMAAVLWFHTAIYHYVSRKRQERRERRFASSLRGDLEREMASTEHQIRLTRSVLWWGLLPVWTATFLLLFVSSRLQGGRGWQVLAMVAVLLALAVVDFRWRQRPLERDLLPRKRELEALREKLDAAATLAPRQ